MPVAPVDLVFARATMAHVAQLFVAGREVVREGRLTGVDLEATERALREDYRSKMPSRAPFLLAWNALEARRRAILPWAPRLLLSRDLPIEMGAEAMTDELPVIDLSGIESDDHIALHRISREIGKACRTIGFFYVINHGVAHDSRRL